MGKKRDVKKLWKSIQNILFAIFMIVMACLIFITAQSRITGKEPSFLSHRIYIVDSGSMGPTIGQDSMIVVRKMASEAIRVGDIVTYQGTIDTKVTHRVMAINNDTKTFTTKGDANDSDDPLPLPMEQVIGKVVFTLPYLGYVLRFLGSLQGIILVTILGGLWIIIPKFLVGKTKEPRNQEALLK